MQFLPNKLYLAMSAALFIAYNGDEDSPVAGSAIVDYCNLNKRALEPVLQKLSANGMIISVKGAKGGYYMPNPDFVTLRDVASVFVSHVTPEKHDIAGYGAILDDTLQRCYESWLDSLSDVTFKRLCKDARNSGEIPTLPSPVLNFSI